MKLSELLVPSASLRSAALWLFLASLCSLLCLGGGKVPAQPGVLYGAIEWSHLSHLECDDSLSEMHSKPPSLLHTSAGMPVHMACLG